MMSRPANVGPGAGSWYSGFSSATTRADPAEHRDRRGEQAVVGADEDPALDLGRDAAAVGADSRVDDREHDAVRQVLHGPHEGERPGPDVEGRDLVGDVDDAQLGNEVEHHGVAHAHELVGPPVVGQERDEGRDAPLRRYLRRGRTAPTRQPAWV